MRCAERWRHTTANTLQTPHISLSTQLIAAAAAAAVEAAPAVAKVHKPACLLSNGEALGRQEK